MTATASVKPPMGRRVRAGLVAFRHSVFWGACRRQGPWLAASLLFALITTGLTILSANAATAIVDQGIVEKTQPLGGLARRLIILSFIGFFVGVASKLIAARIEYTLDLDLRNLLYLRLHRTRPEALNRFSTGQIVTRSLADLLALRFFIQSITRIVTFVPILLGLTIWIFVQSPVMGLIGTSGIIFNGWLINKIRRRLWGYAYLGYDQLSRITSTIDEPVRGARVMKWFGRERAELDKVDKASTAQYRYSLTSERFRARYDVVFRIAPTIVRVLILVAGARLVVGGGLTIGQFNILFTFITFGSRLSESLDSLAFAYQRLKTGAGRLNEVLRGGPKAPPRRFEELPEPTTGLEIHRATVQFGPATAVEDVSLTVRPGTLTVVTGAPGSGKSTIAALAAGALAPTSGQVLVDGIDIERLDPYDVRGAVHLVAEEPFLFGRTIRDNLKMGIRSQYDADAKAADEQLVAAINAARAEDALTSAGGLDAVLGDRGLTLSGGQRQRLSLARALVEMPRVLVLDDALSAVSPTLEIEIIQNLRALSPDLAILCVGRRESLAAIADQVVHLPDHVSAGVAAELGVDDASLADAMTAIAVDRPYDARLVGVVSELKLDDDAPLIPREVAERDERVSIGRLLATMKGLVATVSVIIIAYELLGLVPEYLVGDVVDVIETGKNAKEAGNQGLASDRIFAADKIAAATFAVAVLSAALYFARRMNLAKTAHNLYYILRMRIFSRITKLGIAHFDRELPGAVSTRVVHDVNQVQRFADDIAPDLLTIVLRTLFTLIIVTVLAPSVGPIAIGFAVAVVLVTLGQARFARRLFERERLTLGEATTRFQEDFAGREILSGFGGERRARSEFGALNRTHRDAQRSVEILKAFFSEGLEVLREVCIALIYLRAGNLVLAGVLTTGTVITLRLYVQESFSRIPIVATYWQRWQEALVSIQQINTLWDAEPYPVERVDALPVQELEGAVAFQDVTFTYPGTNRPIIHNVSFEVAPGDRVAIVGHTGAGKSSIAKLLGRIYDPDSGRVLVDGHDIRDYDLSSYRTRIGVVPQEAFLFRGTVASNIAYGKPDATREEVEEAARLVGAYDTLAGLESDFDAKVDEEGRNLTAAERQLIALARAVLAAPDILVLDEATSSLDAATETQVIDAILDLGLTTVLVTHRLPLAERADFVVMLEEGQIIEAGTHAELVASGAHYPKLWGYALSVGPRGAARRRRRAAARAGDPEAVVDLTGTRPAAKKAVAKKTAKVAKKPTVVAKKAAAKANGTKNGKNGEAAAKKPAAKKG